MIFCTKCGAQCNDGQAFCSSCGAKLEMPQNAGDNMAQGYESGMAEITPAVRENGRDNKLCRLSVKNNWKNPTLGNVKNVFFSIDDNEYNIRAGETITLEITTGKHFICCKMKISGIPCDRCYNLEIFEDSDFELLSEFFWGIKLINYVEQNRGRRTCDLTLRPVTPLIIISYALSLLSVLLPGILLPVLIPVSLIFSVIALILSIIAINQIKKKKLSGLGQAWQCVWVAIFSALFCWL